MGNIIEIHDVAKQFVGHKALDGVSMDVREGSVHGLLGPNGAGKTTLIRIINHITEPDSGEVLLNGKPVTQADVMHMGYLPEERGLYKKMKVLDHIVFLGRLKGMTKHDAHVEARAWLDRMDLGEWSGKKIEALSKGMAQKVQFIGTVIHRPKLLIFDEPFSGFDPVNAEMLKKEMLELNRDGSTILFSTHNMASVEDVCKEITLINKSRVALNGSVHDVKERFKKNVFSIKVTDKVVAPADGLFDILELFPDEYGGCNATVRLKPDTDFREAVDYLNRTYRLRGFEEILPSMNEIFIETVTNSGEEVTNG